MRRNCRLILKWILLTGILVITFKICCDALVDIILSTSSSSIVNMEERNSQRSYEDSLIAWAMTGQHAKNKKLTMENIEERHDLQLIGAQVFFRHGARTPLNLLPSLEEVYCEMRKFAIYIQSLVFFIGSL
jgi:hypothetical protein